MLIRKLFKFENAHIVRNCTSDRCKRSIHGHSYKVELLLKASKLDHGQMVYDFGLLKGVIKNFLTVLIMPFVFGKKMMLLISMHVRHLVQDGFHCLFRLLPNNFHVFFLFSSTSPSLNYNTKW